MSAFFAVLSDRNGLFICLRRSYELVWSLKWLHQKILEFNFSE